MKRKLEIEITECTAFECPYYRPVNHFEFAFCNHYHKPIRLPNGIPFPKFCELPVIADEGR